MKSQISSESSRGNKGQHKKTTSKTSPATARWSPASLTFYIYFYLFYLYTRITINNGTPHLKSKITKESKQESRLGTANNKITGGRRELAFGRPTLALDSALVHEKKKTTTNNKNKTNKTKKTKSKAGSWNWRTLENNARITYKTNRHNRHISNGTK